MPAVFRLVHLLLLEEVDRRGPVVALQDLSAALADSLRRAGLVDPHVVDPDGVEAAAAARWSDVVWLTHDLEDWALVELHRTIAPVLGRPSAGGLPVVAGVSLTATGDALLRRTGTARET